MAMRSFDHSDDVLRGDDDDANPLSGTASADVDNDNDDDDDAVVVAAVVL